MKTIYNLPKFAASLLVMLTILSLTACAKDQVEKSEADNNLLIGLLVGQENLKGSLIEIRGSWDQYSCSNGSCPITAKPSANIYISTEPGTNKGVFYQENPPTCYNFVSPGNPCSTSDGEQFPFYPADRSIESFSNSTKRFLYKNVRSTTPSYSYILWGNLDGEVYACDLFAGKSSPEEALKDLETKLASRHSTNPSLFKTTGCGGYAWDLWKKREGVL